MLVNCRRTSRSQMIAWRILAETHSLTMTVAMMISRMSDTWVQASMVIAALSGSPMPPAPTRPSTVDSRMLMSQRNTEMPANAGRTSGPMLVTSINAQISELIERDDTMMNSAAGRMNATLGVVLRAAQ